MSVLTNYFKKLNKSIIYLDHQDYLGKTKAFLNANLEVKGKCLVLGAGNLSDIPLSYLSQKFDLVTLSDIDEEAILSHINDDFHNLEVLKCDYTGLEEAGFFNGLLNQMNVTTDYKKLEQFVSSLLDRNYNDVIKEKFQHAYDLIYISPIYTQLIYNQVLMIFDKAREANYPEEIIKYLEGLILEKMISIINRFNELVVSLLNEDGQIIVYSDLFEGSKADEFMANIIKQSSDQSALDHIYHDYYNKYGFGLGDYGLYSLSELITKQTQQYFVWPLSEEKQYLVSAMILRNKKEKY